MSFPPRSPTPTVRTPDKSPGGSPALSRSSSASGLDEQSAFAAHINTNVCDMRRLPLDCAGADLFDKLRDGVILCKLVNAAMPGTIDERVIDDRAELSRFQASENVQLALASARGCGCRLVNIGVDDVLEGKPNLVLGILWQLVRMQLLACVDLVHVPELLALLEPGETLAELLKLSHERILLRWVNYHLAAAGAELRIANFGEHIKDCAAYATLLQQLEPACDAAALRASSPDARAAAVLREADRLLAGATPYVKAADIQGGNAKLNLAFVATLFNARHGLQVTPSAVPPAAELAELLEAGDSSEGREERVLRFWVTALGLEAAASASLVEEVAGGVFLLQLLDRLSPRCVDWARVAKPPFRLPFKQLENLNLALQLARGPPFHAVLVGVDGKDLLDRNAKLALALLYQLQRYDLLATLRGLAPAAGRLPSDAELVALANAKVAKAGRASRATSFRDPALADSRFFLDLLAAQGAAVDAKLVSTDATDEAREANAKYTLSVARKAGATIFVLWDDITTLKPKMLMALTASILALKD